MKKLALNIFIISLTLTVFNACKSSKKGCGLTSDAQKIEQSTTTQTVLVAEVD